MLESRGAIGAWLWDEYQTWYFRVVKPLRVNDFSKAWVIWDNITLAYVLGMTTQHTSARPRMRDNMRRRLRSSGGRLASSLWLLLPVVADF